MSYIAERVKNRVDLREANLARFELSGLRFSLFDLSYANLVRANLRNGEFRGTNLEGANLEGANLEGANLEGAIGLTQKQVNTAEATPPPASLPEGIEWPFELWVDKNDKRMPRIIRKVESRFAKGSDSRFWEAPAWSDEKQKKDWEKRMGSDREIWVMVTGEGSGYQRVDWPRR